MYTRASLTDILARKIAPHVGLVGRQVGEDPRAYPARWERSGKLNGEVAGHADILATILARKSVSVSVSMSVPCSCHTALFCIQPHNIICQSYNTSTNFAKFPSSHLVQDRKVHSICRFYLRVVFFSPVDWIFHLRWICWCSATVLAPEQAARWQSRQRGRGCGVWVSCRRNSKSSSQLVHQRNANRMYVLSPE